MSETHFPLEQIEVEDETLEEISQEFESNSISGIEIDWNESKNQAGDA